MIKRKKINESKLTFEIEPLTRIEALREANKLKNDGQSTIVVYNENDGTYSVFKQEHYDYLVDNGDVDMSKFKKIKGFEAEEDSKESDTKVVSNQPDENNEEPIDIELNEPSIPVDGNEPLPEETVEDELNDDENNLNVEYNNTDENNLNVEYNNTDEEEMEDEIKKENYQREFSQVDRVWYRLPEKFKKWIKNEYDVSKLTFSQLDDIIKTYGKSFNYSTESKNK
jgi:hypothetical protein